MTHRRAAPAAALVLGLGASPAAAHGSLPGGGGFLSGALHPFVAVEHLVLLLGLGLLSGRLPRERRGAGFAALGAGLVAGLAASALAGFAPPVATPAVLALALVAGLLLAAAPRLPRGVVPALSGLAGLAVGLDTDGAGALGPAAGVVVGAGLIALDAAALSAWATRPPFPVALRVAGSWIAAVALMLLALALGPGPAAA